MKPGSAPSPPSTVRGVLGDGDGDGGGRLKGEHLVELREMLAERNGERFRWLLDDDVEPNEGVEAGQERKRDCSKQNQLGDDEKIELLAKRLSETDLDLRDWKFPRLMRQSGLLFIEMYVLKIIARLGTLGSWRQALSVVEWIYNEKDYKHRKSRFVYTKLLAVLGKARRPTEALRIFNMMREDGQIYPDMAAYHSIAVTLGQAGLLNELIKPDVIIYNAVLNACIPSHQWKGVFWVFQQMRFSGLKPTGASYGLAMEVMLNAGKYEFVHRFFEKMQKGGLTPKALTYKVLVRAFWQEGKVDEAVKAVRDMEQRGVVGVASTYYELACCLCNNGRWQDAMLERTADAHKGLLQVEKLKNLSFAKPLEVAFTGMILASLDGGHLNDCISIFERMKDYCTPNIGTINAMLKVYSRSDMFAEAKELFESTKATFSGFGIFSDDGSLLKPDEYTYSTMLDVSASAHQWEYFEYVYKEMALSGYQPDQKKIAGLLVEASRAGKMHLLEHAFDAILEAGEIPHESMFTEMICQTIAHNNFERTVILVNSMAHSSLRINESQWANLFQNNKDRFSSATMQDLLNYFHSCNLVTEEPVPSFLKSLHSICRTRLLKDASIVADKLNDEDSDIHSSKENSTLQEMVTESISLAFEAEGKEMHSLLNCDSRASITDTALDMLTMNVGNPYAELPSALEILESWKQDRMKDDAFLSTMSRKVEWK
uniref:PROP1-like PPR domain-containing protein n=1 Tax=Ananas comosus var. bracteatus TaxID=296719 RepID=A0A6V7Q3Q5_ANACO|nr:unnamed protein product [Ananas comosus var. bracteatus]